MCSFSRMPASVSRRSHAGRRGRRYEPLLREVNERLLISMPTDWRAMRFAGGGRFGPKCHPKSGAMDFPVFHNLIRDRAGNVYRDGKSHGWIGVARVEERRIDANELAAEIDQRSS
jgi:hypothetical protein